MKILWNFNRKKNFVLYSGIENEHEIYSCAQLEAQQELSKTIENLNGTSKTSDAHDIKVIKKDNIVLGINDLKQQKQRKSSADAKTIGSGNINNNNKSAVKQIVVDKKENNTSNNNNISNNNKHNTDKNSNSEQSVDTINPSNTTLKVNNCEIVNRPRSVTAAIFSHPTILTPNTKSTTKIVERKSASIKNPSKRSLGGPPVKIFRPSTSQNTTSVTSTIFAPRTKDMNKGYLMFSEDDTGLTSKYTLFNFLQSDVHLIWMINDASSSKGISIMKI